jgi:hypothetical protein
VGFLLGGFGLAACGDVRSRPPDDGSSSADSGPGSADGGPGRDGGVDASIDAALLCVSPSSTPNPVYRINLFANADGHTGTYNTCPKVGTSLTTTNPQYISCRRWGGEVRDSAGNYNHYWLWTELDQPPGSHGWISAYYIQGEGNDRAYDINTKQEILDCP